MLDSGFIEFKLDNSKTNALAIGDAIYSAKFPAGGHIWRIKCYPRGHRTDMDDAGEYLSLYLELVTPATNVTAIFDAFLLRADGAPSPAHQNRCVHAYPPTGFTAWGWSHFVHRRHLGSPVHLPAGDGRATFLCGVIVLRSGSGGGGGAGPAPAAASPPACDVASQLGRLLESGEGSDVAFSVGGETFHAHRAVLAARSPVFKAELLGAMAESTTPTVTLLDMDPATFRAMLRFMYTDTVPEEAGGDDLGLLHGLLVAADRYALETLKLVCEERMCGAVSADNVAGVLSCAEMHGCAELRRRCVEFFVEESNLKKAVLSPGYMELVESFPSVVDEIRARVEDRERRVLVEKKKAWSFSYSFGVAKALYFDPWVQKLVDALRD